MGRAGIRHPHRARQRPERRRGGSRPSRADAQSHGSLLLDGAMDGVAYDPEGPLTAFKVPRIEEVDTDIEGQENPDPTLAGPFAAVSS